MNNSLNFQYYKNNFFDISFLVALIIIEILIVSIFYPFTSQMMCCDDAIFIDIANGFAKNFSFENSFIASWNPVNSTNALIEVYPEITSNFYIKGPLYFIVLGLTYKILESTPENWVQHGIFLNIVLSSLFLVIFYFFIKKYFGLNIAILSSLVVLTIPFMPWYSARIVPYILFFIFSLAALFFLQKKSIHYVLAGFFTGLAHLTQPFGIFLTVSFVVFLLIKKEFKGAAIFFSINQLTLLPWLIRNYYLSGDMGLHIPFTNYFSKLFFFIPTVSSTSSSYEFFRESIVTNISDLSLSTLFSDLSGEIYYIYNIDYLLIFLLALTGFAFFKFDNYKTYCEIFYKFSIVGIIVIAYFLLFSFDLPILEIIFVLIMPISLILLFYKFKKPHPFVQNFPRIYLLGIIFGFVSVLGLIYWGYRLGYGHDIKIIFLIIPLLLPFAFKGIENITKLIPRFKTQPKKIAFVISIAILVPLVYDMQSEYSHLYQIETDFLIDNGGRDDTKLHIKLNEIITPESIVASNLPTGVFQSTGISTIPVPPTNLGTLNEIEQVFSYYNVTHIVLYGDGTNSMNRSYEQFSTLLDADFPVEFFYAPEFAKQFGKIYSVHDVLDSDTSNPFAFSSKIKKLERLGELEQYNDAFEKFKEYVPSSTNESEKLCSLTLEQQWYKIAIVSCLNLYNYDPSNAVVSSSLVFLATQVDLELDINKILEDQLQILLDGKDKDSSLLFWSSIFNCCDELESVQLYRTTIKDLADSYHKNNNFQSALLLYDVLSTTDDSFAENIILIQLDIFKQNGDDKNYLDKLDQLVLNYEKRLEKKSDFAYEIEQKLVSTLKTKATIFVDMDELREADIVYRKILGIDRFNIDILKLHAEYLESRGLYVESLHSYELIYKLDPNNLENQEKFEELKQKISS